MPATFELKTTTEQQFHFTLVGTDGIDLLIGGEYPSRQEAEQAISDVRTGSLMGHLIASGKVPAGDSFFVIKNSGGEIIAKSQLFSSQMDFDSTLHQVKDNACVAEITDLTAGS
ncbi:DUF1508 domain-containing protein [Marinobacterium mangrovicola]|uniref:Uncharacterized protein n=1 Tax=Marinobacterium mangrovicola TaxID=1476959 RepID=A0A4R1GMY9_9GAMM|nr:DUF1508 domain-containing protein [Marinobacterium mangrovicola]TCK08553.1 hypothetical protein CLV83_0640 [Marinobacterium mangrovicola]